MSRRSYGRHARHGFAEARPTVADIRARIADEAATAAYLAAYPGSVARQAAVAASMDAPTLTLPVVLDAEIVEDAPARRDPAIAISATVIVQAGEYVHVDPTPTKSFTRAELMAVAEVDGGRPMHDLDYAQVTGGAR